MGYEESSKQGRGLLLPSLPCPVLGSPSGWWGVLGYALGQSLASRSWEVLSSRICSPAEAQRGWLTYPKCTARAMNQVFRILAVAIGYCALG